MERIKMKDMPEDQRPYEKCLKNGPEALTDAELLSILIRTGSRESSSLELAQRLLDLNYPGDGLLGLLHYSLTDLKKIKGIGTVKGIQLVCAGELSRRIWKRRLYSLKEAFNTPAAVADYYMEDLRHLEQEEVRAMFFDTKQALIRDVMISRGTVNASVVSPREVLIEALRCRAVTMILVHNHPSGDPSPSREDRSLTRRMKEAANLVGVPLIDHVIIGDLCFFSFRQENLL